MILTLRSTLLLSLFAASRVLADEKFNECKQYKQCCDDIQCNSGCCERPDCTEYAAELDKQQPTAEWIAKESICPTFFQFECTHDGFVCGDPHFTTWKNEIYDFHGECDLVFLHAPSFGHGLGLDIHVRTTIRNDYSYIESAVIRIGDDVLEVASYGEYFLNGVESAKLDDDAQLASFPLKRYYVPEHDDNLIHYEIFVGHGQEIILKSFKDFVGVKMQNAYADNYKDSTGLLGDFLTGHKLARDGATAMEDEVEFGMEWQVLSEEPQLFQAVRAPQLSDGQKCVMPDITATQLKRRLEESSVEKEAAEKACSHWDNHFKEACVYDVLATGDLAMATAGAF